MRSSIADWNPHCLPKSGTRGLQEESLYASGNFCSVKSGFSFSIGPLWLFWRRSGSYSRPVLWWVSRSLVHASSGPGCGYRIRSRCRGSWPCSAWHGYPPMIWTIDSAHAFRARHCSRRKNRFFRNWNEEIYDILLEKGEIILKESRRGESLGSLYCFCSLSESFIKKKLFPWVMG